MVNDTYRKLKAAAKRDRIFVNSIKYSALSCRNVPEDHMESFAIVQQLGHVTYAEYGYLPNMSPEKPWQGKNKERAARILLYATRCRKENRNEAGWRHEVESRLFERFDIEVACKKCRKRLWRSEIEANPSFSNSRTTSLEDRQKQRAPCTCNPSSRLDDCLDVGINDIFSARIEETCVNPSGTDTASFGPSKKPDRIHGLQQTTNFDTLLQQPYVHTDSSGLALRALEEVVKVSINPDNGGSALLFPFLILEAKGEKGVDNFEEMEIQSAFPIRNALKLQYDLLKTKGNTMDVPGGPLVWFLANRGEDWRVYGACIHEHNGRPDYLINYLWGGSITGYDEALQLILILDYILDWARDIYRPNILRQLKMLTTANISDAMTMGLDPDIYSLRGDVEPWMETMEPGEIIDGNLSGEKADEPQNSASNQGILDQFSNKIGVVRDARFMESRIRGLFITPDNLQTLLLGFDTTDNAKRVVRTMLSILARRSVVLESENVLRAVEDQWIGATRTTGRIAARNRTVYAQFRVSYFIDPMWQQVRELTYLAVTHDAKDALIQFADFRAAAKRYQFRPHPCSEVGLLSTIKIFQKRSVRYDFRSCLQRRTYTITVSYAMIHCVDTGRDLRREKVIQSQDKDKKSPGLQMQGIVHAIYERFRIGQRPPSEPFLRASASIDSRGRPLWKDWSPGDELGFWEKHWGHALVYSPIPDSASRSPMTICLYILNGEIDTLTNTQIVQNLRTVLHFQSMYHTVRRGKVPKTNRNYQENRPAPDFSIVTPPKDLAAQSLMKLPVAIFSWIRALQPPQDVLEASRSQFKSLIQDTHTARGCDIGVPVEVLGPPEGMRNDNKAVWSKLDAKGTAKTIF
ncbi:uncharacterized protein BDR25DRAFT_386024 [Lindgomyces ingoldianus]|uniref:Uncharacterized protein n=1 Tax=Lindgomyces ingoldianus TaxID=673940 RepID=A0ACB6R5N1_9PLEO|nr:uncharacterized protein BDR25DRAFT_386024 [Lindgomyces ingoldianus]KAF2474461.1 hypothetical protein BDR25DRAFT_386024 [Lindgomyces ingoldianus]